MAVDTAPTRPVEARERSASRFTGFLRERGLLLLGIAFIIVYCLAPFYWMIVSSLKANPLLDQALFPTSPTLTNYREVFSSENNFQYALRNSVVVAGTTTILALFIAAWNEFLIAFTMTQTLRAEPVTVSIAKFTGASEFEQPFGTIMAAGVLVTIPLVIVVLIFQRRIVSGLTAGGVKG